MADSTNMSDNSNSGCVRCRPQVAWERFVMIWTLKNMKRRWEEKGGHHDGRNWFHFLYQYLKKQQQQHDSTKKKILIHYFWIDSRECFLLLKAFLMPINDNEHLSRLNCWDWLKSMQEFIWPMSGCLLCACVADVCWTTEGCSVSLCCLHSTGRGSASVQTGG